MTTFRQQLMGVLGTVVSVAACDSAEARLREGLDGEDLCSVNGSGINSRERFSHVTNLEPAQAAEYLEWRQLRAQGADWVAQWDDIKARIVADTSLTNEERQTRLDVEFRTFVSLEEASGSCSPAENCDRFVIRPEPGFFSWTGGYHLFASGKSGSTTITNEEEARVFLGEINTPNEAAWLAFAMGHDIPCDGPNYKIDGDAFLLYTETGSTCGGDVTGHRLRVSSNGQVDEVDSDVVEEGDPGCVIGRLPSGAVAKRCRAEQEHPVGRYFADVARLEAASIFAFRELARDLRHHGAPPELVAWAERSAVEESRHARLCVELAARYGVRTQPVRVTKSSIRSLQDIALDNATEGLTREAFGALVAHHQRHAAKDPAVRAALNGIAREETRHAEFSIALHRWLLTRLDVSARERVTQARLQAQANLGPSLHPAYAQEVVELAGVPTPELSRTLFAQLFAVDWAA